MMMRRASVLLVILCFSLVPAMAGTLPHLPRLTSAPQGALLGGYQTTPGTDGTFELFTLSEDSGVARLGRFNGQLAGVAIDRYDNHLYGLTRDGALNIYGDDPDILAFADSRWNFIDLAWYDGGLRALGYAGNTAYLVRPDTENQVWLNDAEIVASGIDIAQAALVPVDETLHLLWASHSTDMSTGALRHRMRENGKWRELDPLPLGKVQSFVVFRHGDGLSLTALIPPPLAGEGIPQIVRKVWFDREWSDDKPLAEETATRLLSSVDFAGTWSDNASHWLTTGFNGAYFLSPHVQPEGGEGQMQRSARPGRARLDLPPTDEILPWQELTSLVFLLAIIALIILYCRRSRMLSRIIPGRTPDLTSRAAALTIDWLLVSIALSAYHLAAGDIRIYTELLTFGAVNQLFWINLIALALFTTACEAWRGQTPGKWLTGMRVRSALGGPPSIIQIVLRNVARGIDMFPIIFPGAIGALTAMLNKRRQRVGDILGATIVRRHYPLHRRRIILASASPRRAELLQALNLNVKQVPSNIDEESIHGDTPEETAILLAQKKAQTVAEQHQITNGDIVIGADTIVVDDNDVLGKPRDADEAKAMLRRLSGRSHIVMTGVSVWDSATGQGLADVETTEVEFRVLTEREIDDFVATGEPMDKAGAYSVQSGHFVKEVRGSLSNVAGLPMEMLQSMLEMLDS